MDRTQPDPSAALYYYASGQRVALELDTAHLALDLSALRGAQRAALGRAGRELSAQVVLFDTASAPDAKAMAAAPGAVALPVFRSGSTLLVALPEVRVEDEDAEALERVSCWLAEQPRQGSVTETRNGRMTLHPGPALDHDSVALAREVVERCGVASASPRLLRVTPAPKR